MWCSRRGKQTAPLIAQGHGICSLYYHILIPGKYSSLFIYSQCIHTVSEIRLLILCFCRQSPRIITWLLFSNELTATCLCLTLDMNIVEYAICLCQNSCSTAVTMNKLTTGMWLCIDLYNCTIVQEGTTTCSLHLIKGEDQNYTEAKDRNLAEIYMVY